MKVTFSGPGATGLLPSPSNLSELWSSNLMQLLGFRDAPMSLTAVLSLWLEAGPEAVPRLWWLLC